MENEKSLATLEKENAWIRFAEVFKTKIEQFKKQHKSDPPVLYIERRKEWVWLDRTARRNLHKQYMKMKKEKA